MKDASDSLASLPTSNMVTAWLLRLIDKFPIIKKAVRVASNKNPIRLEVGAPPPPAPAASGTFGDRRWLAGG